MGYSIKHKVLTLQKILAPENKSVNEVSAEKQKSVSRPFTIG